MMNNEEFETKKAFIVEQQAQFAAHTQQLQETQAQTEKVVARLANATLAGFNNVDVKLDPLVDLQMPTDETLRNMIAVVDHYFSEDRNGK